MADIEVQPLNFANKKKKKTKVPIVLDEPTKQSNVSGETAPETAPTETKTSGSAKPAEAPTTGKDKEAAVAEVAEELGDLGFTEKKKKKKGALKPLDEDDGSALPRSQVTGETPAVGAEKEAAQTEPQSAFIYSYEMLLERVFAQIQAHNPELMTETKRRLVMAPPCMARVGTKKTQFTNFNSICRSLNRDPSHLAAYLFAELGTTGSVDGSGALLIRGKYQAKHIEPLLRNYARTYVMCSTCQSPETTLSKDSRLLFLQCDRCGSRVSVKNVTSGFQAVTGKRAAMRAKAQ